MPYQDTALPLSYGGILVEAVRFELTDPFGSSVFKTGALSRALPHFHFFLAGDERIELPNPESKSDVIPFN